MATNMFSEHAAQFKDALTNAGLWESGEQPDFERVASKLDISVPYAQQMFEGKQRFSKPMREKLGVSDVATEAVKAMDTILEGELTAIPPATTDENYYEAPYRVNQRSDGSYEIGKWKFDPMAKAYSKEDAEEICNALNSY